MYTYIYVIRAFTRKLEMCINALVAMNSLEKMHILDGVISFLNSVVSAILVLV